MDRIDEEFLIKYMLGECSPDENVMVEDWLKLHPDNEKKYAQFKQIWEAGEKIAVTSTVDEQAAWLRFKKRRDKTPEENQKAAVRTLNYWIKIAAVLFIVLGGGWFAYYQWQMASFPDKLETFSEVRTDTLPDGSIITLNRNSVLKFAENYNEETREVELQGEAFFNVHPNPDKPFIVHVNNIRVRVTGTSFNVKSRDERTEVIVESGSVEVKKKQVIIRLKPQEKAISASADAGLVKEKQSDLLYQFYRKGELIANETPLWRIVEVLSEAYGTDIIIENSRIRNLPITTTFKNEPVERILKVISETLNIEVVEKDGKIYLK